MTSVGLDVHARSTHAAAIDVKTGELKRARFGARSEEVVSWLSELEQPVRAFYEAGPTGFALYRAGQAAGLEIEVIAPGKTARPRSDRVKTDRKDAELLARLGLAGQLSPIAVPSEFCEAARHLMRAREQLRGDLLRARHRVSKLLLQHGRVYSEPTTWNKRHRLWLGRQRFDHLATELAFIDLLAAVDGMVARKEALDEQLSRLATDERLWPTVARLRTFRGRRHPDRARASPRARRELGALLLAAQAVQLAGAGALARAVGGVKGPGFDHEDRLALRPAPFGRGGLALFAPPRIGVTLQNRQAGQPDHVLQIAWRAQHRLHRLRTGSSSAASPPTWPRSRSRASSRAFSGRRRRRMS